MAKVKGSVFKPRLDYVKKKATPDQERQLLDKMSPEFINDFNKRFMVSQWYPFEYYVELNQAIVAILGHGDQKILREVGRYSADDALHGIYKLFFKAGSPEVIIKVAVHAWKQYFQNGELKVDVHANKSLTMNFTNVEILAREHFVSVSGWVQRVLELSGGKSVRVEIGKFDKALVTLEVDWV